MIWVIQIGQLFSLANFWILNNCKIFASIIILIIIYIKIEKIINIEIQNNIERSLSNYKKHSLKKFGYIIV